MQYSICLVEERHLAANIDGIDLDDCHKSKIQRRDKQLHNSINTSCKCDRQKEGKSQHLLRFPQFPSRSYALTCARVWQQSERGERKEKTRGT